jgi:hypothetical protein
MSPSEATAEEVATAYIAFLRSAEGEPEWVGSVPVEYWIDGRWDDLWLLVKAVAELPEEIDDTTLAAIAAGPLEDLLSKAPAAYAERVLAAAPHSPRLARMLTGVWRSSIDAGIWDKVVDFCRKVPDPIDGVYASQDASHD